MEEAFSVERLVHMRGSEEASENNNDYVVHGKEKLMGLIQILLQISGNKSKMKNLITGIIGTM